MGQGPDGEQRMGEAELAATRRRRPEARASLACEGIHLTPEEEALFEQMDEQRLTHEQREAFLIDYIERVVKRPSA